ncbi:MAG: hypothetical protein V1750_02155 [Acidobacteriota bacterium]
MAVEETTTSEVVVVSQTSGEETQTTVVQVVTTHVEGKPEEVAEALGEEPTIAEVIEAILDPDGAAVTEAQMVEVDTFVVVTTTSDTELEGEEEAVDVADAMPSEAELSAAGSSDVAMESQDFAPVAAFEEGAPDYSAPSPAAEPVAEEPAEGTAAAAEPSEVEREAAEAAAHGDAAREAQERADTDIAAGDYEAASKEREIAENEAWEASDSSMLHGRESAELDTAADYHERADRWEQEEAKAAEAGDYEGAREAAREAGDAQGWSDFKAGGDDHTGQARAEYAKEDQAVWQEQQAKEAHENAEWYAERGNLDQAESYEKSAESHQEWADQYGREGQHDAPGAVWDPSSETTHDTPVGGDDASAASTDTGSAVATADSSCDTAADTSYDSSADTGATDE